MSSDPEEISSGEVVQLVEEYVETITVSGFLQDDIKGCSRVLFLLYIPHSGINLLVFEFLDLLVIPGEIDGRFT